MTDTTAKAKRADLIIKTNKEHGEADLDFLTGHKERLAQLHGKVVKVVDGVSAKGRVADFVVDIRKDDFDEVVRRLKRFYRNQDITVKVESVGP